eukprot:scaffold25988_cov63-Phaeocystis_antarctica.AAC.2
MAHAPCSSLQTASLENSAEDMARSAPRCCSMRDDSPSRSATKKSASSALKASSRASACAPSAACITARRTAAAVAAAAAATLDSSPARTALCRSQRQGGCAWCGNLHP